MAPQPKLSDADVKRIRRRVGAGARKCDLAAEYGVNRKTITRRVKNLDERDRLREDALAAKRQARQVQRELRKLRKRKLASPGPMGRGKVVPTTRSDYLEWLDTPKNLSAPAAFAHGLIRVRTPDGRNRRSVDPEVAEKLIGEGWVLSDA